jgi:hypothetical protein
MLHTHRSRKFLLTFLVSLISLTACTAKSTTNKSSNSAKKTNTFQATDSAKSQSKTSQTYISRHKSSTKRTKNTQTTVKVFFPRNPNIEEDFTKVEPVARRIRANSNLSRFAIEQLIAGPTSQEKSKGLIDTIKLTGKSNCGSDFTLSINQQVARLQFCKNFPSGGVGDVARTKSSINATLKQFSTVKSVVILDKNGNCWGDESGENLCLRPAIK